MIFIVSFFLSMISFDLPNDQITESEMSGYRGPVKQVIINEYNSNDTISPTKKTTAFFSRNGEEIRYEMNYDKHIYYSYYINYKHNSKGRKTSGKGYSDKGGFFLWDFSYYYDNKGFIKREEKAWDSGFIASSNTYTVDSLGRIFIDSSFAGKPSSESFLYSYKYTYDSSGYVIEKYNQKKNETEHFVNDVKGNPITLDFNGHELNYEYSYDSFGNWTYQCIKNNGEITHFTKREFIYW